MITRTGSRRSRTCQGIPNMLDERGSVEVLLVGDGPQVFSLSQGQLERKGCRCHFAKSQRKLKELLNQKQFDIVLTMPRIEGGSTDWLGQLYQVRVLHCSASCLLKSVVGGCLYSGLGKNVLGLPPCVRVSFPMPSLGSSIKSRRLQPKQYRESPNDSAGIFELRKAKIVRQRKVPCGPPALAPEPSYRCRKPKSGEGDSKPREADTACKVFKTRLRAERIEAGAHENPRAKPLRIAFLEPGHGLILLAQTYVDHGNLGSI
jgi:hypothetical protein